MQSLTDELSTRMAPVLAHTPRADRDAVAALFVDETCVGAALDAVFARFSASTCALLRAHGRWARFDPSAQGVCDVSPDGVALALAELLEAGWLTEAQDFPLPVRAWRRARLQPTPAMVQAAADAAEAAFHWFRCAGAGDIEAQERLSHWSAWSAAPEVAEWAAIADQQRLGASACVRCRPWAAIEESRAAQWRGWEEQASRWLDRAAAASSAPRLRFFVRFLRAIRTVQARDPQGARLVEALAIDVPDEQEWVFVHQAQAVLAQAQSRDARPALLEGLWLAERHQMPFRRAHLRLLLALAAWPDGARMLQELELIQLEGVRLTVRDRWNLAWAWVRAHLASHDLPTASKHARRIVDDPELAALNAGGSWSVIALAHRQAGEDELAEAALLRARRALSGSDGLTLRRWLDHVWETRDYDALPDMAFAHAPLAGWVARDGSRFRIGEDEVVELERSPVSVALLAACLTGPQRTDELIEACWPGDASSYSSLKNRLHSAVRTLRRKGLEAHLLYDGDAYRVQGLQVVDR